MFYPAGSASVVGFQVVPPAVPVEGFRAVNVAGSQPAAAPPLAASPAPPPASVQITAKPYEIEGQQFEDVYFDSDKSDIREDARATLTRVADSIKAALKANPNFTLIIEGHNDERGSAEYNLGAADRRAQAVKDFLVQLGVPADRLKVISYGKERPVCTVSTDDCLQQNRRVHFAAYR